MTRNVVLALSIIAWVGLAGCQSPGAATPTEPKASSPPSASKPSPPDGDEPAKPASGDPLHPLARIETSVGNIVIELNAAKAPATVLNFIHYAQNKYYDGTIFHRVLKESMIQGGGYDANMNEKSLALKPAATDTWMSELKNQRGAIALVRPDPSSGKNAAQFFISLINQPDLDSGRNRGSHAVFGRVVEGMDTAERICNTPVGPHPNYAAGKSAVVPTEPVVIKTIRLIAPFDPGPVMELAEKMGKGSENRIDAVIAELEEAAGSKMTTTENGVRYVDFGPGHGHKPGLEDYIVFQYRGTLLDGAEFENTYKTKPAARQVKTLIPGLQEVLVTMQEGGRRTAIVPPQLAYGEAGIPGRIPPDSTLVFELELLEIK
jgi:cyclophilin family peptidyl-prolyl cis-trans isomerase